MTLEEASTNFHQIVKEAISGRATYITEKGLPIAQLTPIEQNSHANGDPKDKLLARLSSQQAMDCPKWDRGELYDRKPC